MTMRVMLDNGVIIHSEFAEIRTYELPLSWAGHEHVTRFHRLRKKASQNSEYQRQKNALFTIGRMIREENLKAFTYNELNFERIRGRPKIQDLNALKGCNIQRCPPALERSKFRGSSNFKDVIAKGGKVDRKNDVVLGSSNQIAFFDWLSRLTAEEVQAYIQNASRLKLSDFEIGSLENIDWFQFVCKRWGSPENYPDVFHLWTAERNGLDAFLTMENTLPNLVSSIRDQTRAPIEIKTAVLRPLELLRSMGVDEPDPVLDLDNLHPYR